MNGPLPEQMEGIIICDKVSLGIMLTRFSSVVLSQPLLVDDTPKGGDLW